MRECNEDALLALPGHGFFAVADGLGGLPEGGIASSLAVDLIRQWFEAPGRNGKLDFLDLFSQVNSKVHDEGRRISADVGIGTTLTAVRLLNNQVEIGHVGDSGLYHFRKGQPLRRVTTDHTMAEEMRARLRPGDNMYIPDYYSHTLTRCIGQGGDIEVDRLTVPVRSGDRLLLYTDGLTKVLEPEEINVKVWAGNDPEQLVRDLIKLSNERGGPDNITTIAVFL